MKKENYGGNLKMIYAKVNEYGEGYVVSEEEMLKRLKDAGYTVPTTALKLLERFPFKFSINLDGIGYTRIKDGNNNG